MIVGMENDSPVPKPSQSARIRRERFVRVAAKRTQRILDAVRALGNCANRTAYQYDSADVQKIFTAIDRELEAARVRFSAKDDRKETLFSFE